MVNSALPIDTLSRPPRSKAFGNNAMRGPGTFGPEPLPLFGVIDAWLNWPESSVGTSWTGWALMSCQKLKKDMRDGGRVRNQLCPLDYDRMRGDEGNSDH